MSIRPTRSTALVLAALLTLAAAITACTAEPDQEGVAEAPAGDPTTAPLGAELALDGLDEELQTLVSNVAIGYRQADGVWPGFVPNDHPTVIVRKDDANTVVDAIAVNHPDPTALGAATPIELDGLPFGSLHRIEDPADREAMDRLEFFEFHATLGGVDSFAMVASSTDDFFDPTTKDYVSTLLHEMFHRYQDEAFSPMMAQDVEGYAYTAENLELAVLEERALADAIEAGDASTRDRAATRFAAIRQARRAADPRVALDDSQEIIEGTARYLEHRLGDQPGTGYLMDATNYDRDLITDFDETPGIKEAFGFGRWYASGAAALHLLDLMNVDDVAARVEAGESPAEILAAELGVTDSNRDELVADARSAYDPDGALAADAVAAAEQALTEGPVFDDAGGEGEDR